MWLIVAGLLAATVAMQRPEAPDADAVERRHAGLKLSAPGAEQKLFAKLIAFSRQMTLFPQPSTPVPAPPVRSAPSADPASAGAAATTSTAATDPAATTAPASAAPMPGDLGVMMQQMSDAAVGWEPVTPPSLFSTPAMGPLKNSTVNKGPADDRLRVAILAGESIGPSGVTERLDLLESVLDPASEINGDAEIVRALYGVEKSEVPNVIASLDAQKLDAFKQRHGLFADLALSRGDSTGAFRNQLATDGTLIITVFAIVLFLFGIVFVTGICLLIVALVQLANGKLRSGLREMAASPSGQFTSRERLLFVEAIAVFFAGFLGLKLVAMGLEPHVSGQALLLGTLLGQWCLAITILWPVARGMTFARWRQFVGLVAPRGVFREIGAGFCGYSAWLSVYFCAAFVIVMIVYIISIASGEPPVQQDPGGKIADVLGSNNPLVIAIVFTLATMWAPLVEESIFRGMLFRTWRRPLGVVLAAIGSSAVFAGVHGYMLLQVVLVGLLGFGFALIREWRGSIIGCMTAHCTHNFVVTLLMIVVLGLAS